MSWNEIHSEKVVNLLKTTTNNQLAMTENINVDNYFNNNINKSW